MSNRWKNFVEVALFGLNLCQNQFNLPVRSTELGCVDVLVFYGA